jgi:hypothetical protein
MNGGQLPQTKTCPSIRIRRVDSRQPSTALTLRDDKKIGSGAREMIEQEGKFSQRPKLAWVNNLSIPDCVYRLRSEIDSTPSLGA